MLLVASFIMVAVDVASEFVEVEVSFWMVAVKVISDVVAVPVSLTIPESEPEDVYVDDSDEVEVSF